MSLEIYKKIELEDELQKLISQTKSEEDIVSIDTEKYGLDNANYLIEAYLMPIDEITKEIEKYDNSKPKLDEVKFIDSLCEKYNVERKAIIQRIQNVRKINEYKSLSAPERLQSLKIERDLLQREKDRLSDKSMDNEEKSVYYFGLGVVTIVGGILFYPASPILVGLIPVAYAVGLPTIRTGLMMKKEYQLVNKLVNISKEIDYLNIMLNKSKDENLGYEGNIDKIDVLESINNTPVLINEETQEIGKKLETSSKGPTLVKRRYKKMR